MKEEGVQYTIAYMHWGTEYQTQQSQEQTDYGPKGSAIWASTPSSAAIPT